MAKKMNEIENQLLAFLCNDEDPWHRGYDTRNDMISFDRDGTGTIECGAEMISWLALEFTWSWNYNDGGPVMTRDGFEFTIDMTLTTSLPKRYHERNRWLKGEALQEHLKNPPPPSEAPFIWAPLHSAAFRPKQLTVKLSRGRFIEPWHVSIKKPYPLFQFGGYRFAPTRYASQLLFTDIGPYPPREEWDQREGHVDFHHWWEKKDFVRDYIERKDETWAETFDLSWWLSPTMGEFHIRHPN